MKPIEPYLMTPRCDMGLQPSGRELLDVAIKSTFALMRCGAPCRDVGTAK